MISFLNFIFIKGENIYVVDSNNYFTVSSSSSLDAVKEERKRIIQNDDFTLTIMIKNKDKFQIEPSFSNDLAFSFILNTENNLSPEKVINVKIITSDDEERNLKPETIETMQALLLNKKIEFEFANHDKMIFSNENLEETDPNTHQQKQFNGYLKYIFSNGEFKLSNLREWIMYKQGILDKKQVTLISKTSEENNENNKSILDHSDLSLSNDPISKNKNQTTANILSNVHQNPAHMNYYFVIIPMVVILVLCLSVFLFWLKK